MTNPNPSGGGDFMARLNDKAGPLPVWGWILIGGGAFYWFVIRPKSAAAPTATAGGSTTQIPVILGTNIGHNKNVGAGGTSNTNGGLAATAPEGYDWAGAASDKYLRDKTTGAIFQVNSKTGAQFHLTPEEYWAIADEFFGGKPIPVENMAFG